MHRTCNIPEYRIYRPFRKSKFGGNSEKVVWSKCNFIIPVIDGCVDGMEEVGITDGEAVGIDETNMSYIKNIQSVRKRRNNLVIE